MVRSEIDNLTQFAVSVLFSEPKIPQSVMMRSHSPASVSSFSALQRAENSSIVPDHHRQRRLHFSVSVLFSEPKIPQCRAFLLLRKDTESFSALQRAENSSIDGVIALALAVWGGFSALQRAENSSIKNKSSNSPD